MSTTTAIAELVAQLNATLSDVGLYSPTPTPMPKVPTTK